MALSVRNVVRLRYEIQFIHNYSKSRFLFLRYSSSETKSEPEKENFRVFQLKPKQNEESKKTIRTFELNPPRSEKMECDQDWTAVWPGPRTFHPAIVPLPIRQGCNKKGPPPDKNANTELMKIPNFLHLTPAAIKKHCEAIKQFCTEWPKSLETDEDIEKHFPVQIISSDYCHSSPTIRDPMSRIISLKIKLSSLKFDTHSKDKFLRLVGKRYDPDTDTVTITSDNCPMKKQNYDYVQYLFTAAYFESWKFEEWENEKSDLDMEEYVFQSRSAKKKVDEVFKYNEKPTPDTTKFGIAVENWVNKGDTKEFVEEYKKASMALLSLPVLDSS